MSQLKRWWAVNAQWSGLLSKMWIRFSEVTVSKPLSIPSLPMLCQEEGHANQASESLSWASCLQLERRLHPSKLSKACLLLQGSQVILHSDRGAAKKENDLEKWFPTLNLYEPYCQSNLNYTYNSWLCFLKYYIGNTLLWIPQSLLTLTECFHHFSPQLWNL